VWHQWLRHQRESPPSLTEQTQELARRERLQVLAAQADARWEAKPSLMDRPGEERGQPVPTLNTGKTQPQQRGQIEGRENTVTSEVQEHDPNTQKTTVADPWKRASGPSETWQPQAWNPGAAKRSS
jgi:NADH dehydrogenase [ubiquinone] 1 alpha subcomplex assembly factor 2